MNFISRSLVVVVASAVSSVCAAATIIDDFSTTSLLVRNGAGTVTQTTIAGGALGGERFESVGILAGNGSANLKINSPLAGIGAMSSESGVDSLFGLTYGNVTNLNANLSLENAFLIRMKLSDIGSTNSTIIVTTAGIGSASASYTLPSLVGLGGPPTPFDVTVPFASFSGAAVDFGDIDRIAYSFNLKDSADWQIQLLTTNTTAVPTPSAAIGGLVLLIGLFVRRLRLKGRA